MSDIVSQLYLLSQQYHNSLNLHIRFQVHERFSTNPQNWFHWVFDQFEIPAESRILELGSGSGLLWLKNLDRLPPTWEITLSDLSSGMLEDARQNLAASSSRFQFAVIDAQAIPCADNSFDYVIANHMLYHVPDRTRAFAEICRVLSPQGRFYTATNGARHLQEMKDFCTRAGITSNGILDISEEPVFSLQNGPAQMVPWFSHIDLRRMESDLAITEAKPLIDFLLSCMSPQELDETKIQTLSTLINQELVERNVIHVTKEVGLFVAY